MNDATAVLLFLILVLGGVIPFFLWSDKYIKRKTHEAAAAFSKQLATNTVIKPKENTQDEILPKHAREEVMYGFATFLEKSNVGAYMLRDTSELPYSKRDIIYSYLVEISQEKFAAKRKLMERCLLCVVNYQDGVGEKGVDLMLDKHKYLTELFEMPLTEINKVAQDKFQRFQKAGEDAAPMIDILNKERAKLSSLCKQFAGLG